MVGVVSSFCFSMLAHHSAEASTPVLSSRNHGAVLANESFVDSSHDNCFCYGNFAEGSRIRVLIYDQDDGPSVGTLGTVIVGGLHPNQLLGEFDNWYDGHSGHCSGADCGTCSDHGTSRWWVDCLDVGLAPAPPTPSPPTPSPPTPSPPTPSPPAPAPPAPSPPPSSDGTIRARSSQKCLDVPGGNPENGQWLWTWECLGSDAQKWAWKSNAGLVWDGGMVWTKCLDVPGGDLTNGNYLELWDCNGFPQQQWGYDSDAGTIYLASSAGDASKCLDLQNGGQSDGTPVQLWDCLEVENQKWDVNLQSLDVAVV